MELECYLVEAKNYQDLYRFVSSVAALLYLKQGYISSSNYDDSVDDPDYNPSSDLSLDKNGRPKPRIYTTRDKNYHYADEYTDELHINRGALYGTPQSNIFCFVLDGKKITEKYKVIPSKNKSNDWRMSPEAAKKGLRNILSRSEAEERILTKTLPLRYVKEIIFMERVADNRGIKFENERVQEVFKRAEELGIKTSRSKK